MRKIVSQKQLSIKDRYSLLFSKTIHALILNLKTIFVKDITTKKIVINEIKTRRYSFKENQK